MDRDKALKLADKVETWAVAQHNELKRLQAINAELLAALEEIREECGDMVYFDDGSSWCFLKYDDLIAKAKG